jgi:acyl carrier protein
LCVSAGNELSADDLANKVKEKLAVMLMMPADDIDSIQPMIHYGVDSLTSIDISAWMMKEFDVHVNQMDILEGLTTQQLIEMTLA